jgi:hypothetical protein
VGIVAVAVGLPYRGIDGWTLGFLFLGPWGAAIGLFAGQIFAGQRLSSAMTWLVALFILGPLAVALLTAVFSTPMFMLLRYLDAQITQILLLVTVWWYLFSAATGVELLDRQLKR